VPVFPVSETIIRLIPLSCPVKVAGEPPVAVVGKATPETVPFADTCILKIPESPGRGVVNVPQYVVTDVCVEFRLENPPLLLFSPVYVPDNTPPLIVPVNVKPPPDRVTVFDEGS
jgi:hypothetical protein